VRRAPLVVTVLLAAYATVALAGCGSSSPSISEDASQQLELRVAAVRNAASARDRAGAEAALADLRRSVETLRSRDEVSSDRATEILDAAATVEARLQSIPTTTTTTTTLPPPTRGQDEDDNRGRGRGREKGGENGGDD
jgi:predicted component of type VI protein secretion system